MHYVHCAITATTVYATGSLSLLHCSHHVIMIMAHCATYPMHRVCRTSLEVAFQGMLLIMAIHPAWQECGYGTYTAACCDCIIADRANGTQTDSAVGNIVQATQVYGSQTTDLESNLLLLTSCSQIWTKYSACCSASIVSVISHRYYSLIPVPPQDNSHNHEESGKFLLAGSIVSVCCRCGNLHVFGSDDRAGPGSEENAFVEQRFP